MTLAPPHMQAKDIDIQRIETQYNATIRDAVRQFLNHMVMLRKLAKCKPIKTQRQHIATYINTFMNTLTNANQVRRISLDLYEPPRKRQRTA